MELICNMRLYEELSYKIIPCTPGPSAIGLRRIRPAGSRQRRDCEALPEDGGAANRRLSRATHDFVALR